MKKTSPPPNTIPVRLIAPCGMNCRLCRAYNRDKDPCPGCRGDDVKFKFCLECSIRNCETFADGKARYCFQCTKKYPCARLKQLDKRYRTKYQMSMLENLRKIKEIGLRKFIAEQKAGWACPECGTILRVHLPKCEKCGSAWR